MAKAVITLTTQFADETKRDIDLGPLAVTAADKDVIKARVKALDVDEIKDLYVSDAGAELSKIAAAKITVTDEKEINLN